MFFCRKESLTSNDPSRILKEARKIIEKIRDKCRENVHTTPFIKSSGLKSKSKFYIKKKDPDTSENKSPCALMPCLSAIGRATSETISRIYANPRTAMYWSVVMSPHNGA